MDGKPTGQCYNHVRSSTSTEANGDLSQRRGAFNFAQAVLPLLLNATSLEHPPTLIFTSATAAMKGSALCASFSTGKFAMRSLSQSLAREFGPKGVHVTHAIIDGVIDIERTKDWKFDAPDAKIKPDAVRRLPPKEKRTTNHQLFVWLKSTYTDIL